MRRIRPLMIVLVALAGFGLTACGGDDDEPGATGGGDEANVVEVGDNVFDPEEISVSTGDTVTWEWVGEVPHNVVNADDFKSKTQSEGEFEHTFDEAGTYDYVCTLHPEMTGVVEVAG